MWYSVPESRAAPEAPPTPIFPWERQSKRPTTTRIFSEDYPSSPQLDHPGSPPGIGWADSTGGMERYIRGIMEQADKPHPHAGKGGHIDLPDRRESLVFTGFPELSDRPSLPVTPAPVIHHPFWAENETKEEIEQTQGLMDQAEWVCPHCGFASHDPAMFTALRSATLPIDVPVAPALPRPIPLRPASPKVDNTLPLNLRPVTVQRESSSDMSALSGTSNASTIVPVETKPAISPPESPPEKVIPKQSLPPPAWLTAAIIENDEGGEEKHNWKPAHKSVTAS